MASGYAAWSRARMSSARGDAMATERYLREAEREAADWFDIHTGATFLADAAESARPGRAARAGRGVSRARRSSAPRTTRSCAKRARRSSRDRATRWTRWPPCRICRPAGGWRSECAGGTPC